MKVTQDISQSRSGHRAALENKALTNNNTLVIALLVSSPWNNWTFTKIQLETTTELIPVFKNTKETKTKSQAITDKTQFLSWIYRCVPIITLCSSRIQLRTWRHASTPSSSKGRCRGKSTMEKRELSGRAKVSERLSSWGRTSTSTRLCPASGTGERSSRYTQDSISRRSASSWLPFSSTDSAPVNTRHMVSLERT